MPAFSSPRSSALVASLIGLLVSACSNTVIGGSTGGAGGSGGDVPIETTGTAGSDTTVASSSSGVFGGCANPSPVGLPAAACTPTDPSCGAGSSVCLATTHAQGAPAFDMRIAHIVLSAPKAFTHGIVKSIFQDYTRPHAPTCNLYGQATFNWLLRFDTSAGTLTVGAAKPVPDPATSYAFLHGPVALGDSTFPVAPVTLSASLAPTCGVESSAGDVLLPFYGDVAGNTYTIFPLRSLRFFDTLVTPDHDCIGAYDAAGLDPANNCIADDAHPDFIDGGHLDAFISLEEADTVLIPPLDESLCVLLSEDATTYGDGGHPRRCKRSNNAIVFQGDWCSATNQPASGGCADAVRFAGSFAASGTTIQ
ncbi:MAG: hypothetical protein QM820_08370 [Minicystis sp.]